MDIIISIIIVVIGGAIGFWAGWQLGKWYVGKWYKDGKLIDNPALIEERTKNFVSSKEGQKSIRDALDSVNKILEELDKLSEINNFDLNKPLM